MQKFSQKNMLWNGIKLKKKTKKIINGIESYLKVDILLLWNFNQNFLNFIATFLARRKKFFSELTLESHENFVRKSFGILTRNIMIEGVLRMVWKEVHG